jgi:serine/threonine protein kinase
MTDKDHLDGLVDEWQRYYAAGRDVPAVELCRDCPRLLAELERRLGVLRHMHRLADPTGSPAEYKPPDPGSPETTADCEAEGAAGPATPRMDMTVPPTVSQHGVGPWAGLGFGHDSPLVTRYELLGEVGRGGMGVVYRGRHAQLDRPVAVKVMLPHAAADRFRREARLLAQVRSPHVVAVYDFDVAPDGRPVLVMEWVEGTDLRRLINSRGGPIQEAEVLPWMRDVCEGMRAAHDAGIIHRDLKPANLLIDARGCARVADFGLARTVALPGVGTQSGGLMGTPHYMAPEQAEDPRGVDGRADVYGFGATFYHALTGRPPFDGETAFSVLYKSKTEPLPAPRSVNPDLSGRTAEILERCLAKTPAERFPTFAEVLRSLDPPPGAPAPWSDLDDRDLAPYLARYNARRDAYLAERDAWNEDLDVYTFPRGQALRIVRGNIVEQPVEAVVSSDNFLLQMGFGVSAAILAAAGPDVASQAAALPPVRPGRVAVTSAGRLPLRLVFHGVMVGWIGDQVVRPSRDPITEVLTDCFHHADTHGVRSIAIPLLGTGVMCFPHGVCLDATFHYLARTLLRGLTCVREVRVVLFRDM